MASRLAATSVCHIVISMGPSDVAGVAVPVAADGVPWSPSSSPPPQAARPSTRAEHARKKNTERAVEWPCVIDRILPFPVIRSLVPGADHLVDFAGGEHHAVHAARGVALGADEPQPLERRAVGRPVLAQHRPE